MIFIRAYRLASPYPERHIVHLYTNGDTAPANPDRACYVFAGVAPATGVPDSREVAGKYRPLIRALQSLFDTTEDLAILVKRKVVAAWNERFLVVVHGSTVAVYNKTMGKSVKTLDEFQAKLALSVILARLVEILKLIGIDNPDKLRTLLSADEADEVKMALAPGAILYVHPSVKSVASTSYPSDP